MQNLEGGRENVRWIAQVPRRKLLKGVAIGTAGIAGTAFLNHPLHVAARAQIASRPTGVPTPVQEILHIARTAERLAVTFYTHGLAHAADLGLKSAAANSMRMMLVEEQLHEFFFRDNGGQPLTSLFSFPYGPATFTNLTHFVETQQQLEGIFNAIFLAAVREFVQQQQDHLAQIAAQIATTEAEHRVAGRITLSKAHSDNQPVAPIPIKTVAAVPLLLAKAGYLSLNAANTYTFTPVGITHQV